MSENIYAPLSSLDEIVVGSSIVTPGRSLFQSDIMVFCGLVGDLNALHVDELEAARHPIGRIVAPATLVASISIGLLASTRWLTAVLVAFLGMEDWRVHAPTFPGDRIDARVTVADVANTSDGARQLVTLRFEVAATRSDAEMRAQDNQRVEVMSFQARFLAASPKP